ncbi:5-formyltetrahydrofolate cyclo-ligase [Solwaraspora sp. WMMD1047]|uniref:5-formyltetrahydrofolate cyclo-ligase n=1 Tax=Solwaraspora sp. WMMD1047 TaxID=3016102 RepID=UPI002415F795|nr:5-formyltetrahydrofolate cyclo-ligase [Solwaraspora sp. WMMD1047]MDG4834103.1 5-formyltetrahydrofolate cyclo-ligase [Solwaraspora sp. WMMD1047]
MSNADPSAQRAKQAIREHIWSLLERHLAVEPGVSGHIPAFFGADTAAELLTTLPPWKSARVIKANPDRAQLPARVHALENGKTVYMAIPNLATVQPFYLLDPATLPPPVAQAAAHQVAATLAHTVTIDAMPTLDLVVCGSVAVNADGARVGKGAGYSDLELALLAEAGLIGSHTIIVTTVHPIQIVNGSLPETPHDFRVDAIITPETIITCPPVRRPDGVLWDHLTPEKIATIPVLASRALHRNEHKTE